MARAIIDDRPVIGITSRHGSAEWIAKNSANYMRVLEENSAQWVILAPDAPALIPGGQEWHPDPNGVFEEGVLDTLDGLILAGGGDVHPRHFGQAVAGADPDSIDPKRDALELALTRGALERGMPVFGICRGCQVLNVAAGGRLVQHLDGHRSSESGTIFHNVRVAGGSRLHSVTGAGEILVNTFHHQGVDGEGVAPGFIASGIAFPDSWLVEAIESRNGQWAVGVQWHPERNFELDAVHNRIWRSFVAAAADWGERRRS